MNTPLETKEIAIDKLVTENLQIRMVMQEDCIRDYADVYRENPTTMPPVTVVYDAQTDTHYLADGFHRVIAAKRAGCDTIKASIHDGTFDDALKLALGANDKHGLRRTNADKRNALEIAWQNRGKLFGKEKPTERQFAEICAVSNGTAHNFLADIGLLKLSNGALGDRALPDSVGADHRAARTPDALTVTSDHLEERNESIRELLRQGKDRYGMDIPEKLMPAFLSREPRIVMRNLGRIRDFLEQKRLAGDIAFAHSVGNAMRDVDAAIRDLRHGAVHCVCRMCRGHGCGSCSDLGFQTRLQYDRVPLDYKAETR